MKSQVFHGECIFWIYIVLKFRCTKINKFVWVLTWHDLLSPHLSLKKKKRETKDSSGQTTFTFQLCCWNHALILESWELLVISSIEIITLMSVESASVWFLFVLVQHLLLWYKVRKFCELHLEKTESLMPEAHILWLWDISIYFWCFRSLDNT